MNLKDAILSTISEIQNHEDKPPAQAVTQEQEPIPPFKINENVKKEETPDKTEEQSSDIIEDKFLHDLRERILVLFEGFQSPNNANIEAKVDLTLNFLEHLLAKIDSKLDKSSH